MGHVIACVTKNATRICGHGGVPVPEDHCVCELPEGQRQCNEKRGRHDKSVSIHGQIVMDTVEEEVEGDEDAVVW